MLNANIYNIPAGVFKVMLVVVVVVFPALVHPIAILFDLLQTGLIYSSMGNEPAILHRVWLSSNQNRHHIFQKVHENMQQILQKLASLSLSYLFSFSL